MDKEVVVHIYNAIFSQFSRSVMFDSTTPWIAARQASLSITNSNGILLSRKKKWIGIIGSDVDGPRVCHTEWSMSEREKQVSYINTYIWNSEKWYW